ncbi:MAG TPA: hypothetical protein VFV50_11140 [Bdellovibrionales bacterium]|nr:hypothetical protein [Bdellovibrionales bacterium]
MAERVFRVFSLAFLSIGFVVAVAGADRDGAQDLANATTDLIQHVSVAKEANNVNATSQTYRGITLTSETNFIAQAPTAPVVAEVAGSVNAPVEQKPTVHTLPPNSN